MYEPVRGGTRGGQAEFKWTDVSADKDRENYLGHSINAPTGRWQKNKDIHWYNRDQKQTSDEQAEEIRRIKELEAEALSAALGFAPSKPSPDKPSTGANSVPVPGPSQNAGPAYDEEKRRQKEERRRLKEEKKADKRARKELKRLSLSGAHSLGDLDKSHSRRHHDRSRSRSPRYRSRERRTERRIRSRSRSRTPPDQRRARINARNDSQDSYDSHAREREREADRRRWDFNNARRDAPSDRSRYH